MMATLDWYGCATFRLMIGELVVFLDAYIDRVEGAPGPGLVADDIDRCDFIVVGHSHFDHLWGAERIARHTGATIIGFFETVRVMEAQGIPLDQLDAGSGRRADPARCRRARVGVPVAALVRVVAPRACQARARSASATSGVTYSERQERIGWPASNGSLRSAAKRSNTCAISHQGARGDGGALVYLFDTPEGQLLYQDTSGFWSGLVQRTAPGCRDHRGSRPGQHRRRADPGLAGSVRGPAGGTVAAETGNPVPSR